MLKLSVLEQKSRKGLREDFFNKLNEVLRLKELL